MLGDYSINLQTQLDGILPGLAPLGLTLLLAWCYSKKISSLKLVVIIFVVALGFSLLGF